MKQQEKLNSLIRDLTADTMPRSLILLGDRGCGKHTLVKEIGEKLSFDVVDISDSISLETIYFANTRVNPTIYTINASDLTVKNENTILKFLEEPLDNTYIIILCESKSMLIETVLNRCVMWEFESYSREFLSEFVKDTENWGLILDLCTTPGQILELDSVNIKSMFDLADKMFNRIGFASIPNALSIADKFAFKNEKGKMNIETFSKILLNRITELVRKETDYKYYHAYVLVDDLVNSFSNRYANKKYLFEDFLIRLRVLFRGDES